VKGISILGSTGSIGTNTLRVLERLSDRFAVIGLGAGSKVDELAGQIERFHPRVASVHRDEDARALRERFAGLAIGTATPGMVDVATHPDVDLLVSATVGAVGLVPTLRALEAGKTVALANKETLVIAGEIMTRAMEASGARLLPVDSEHNAIHQCLTGQPGKTVRRLWLTASGGPFRNASLETMRGARPAEALKHPTWQMGPKITIDSATMMNKGFEVIEACWLFGVRPSQVRIVVHPQSTIHSMVEFEDGSVLAQLGVTDMRLPIQYALTYPERLPTGLPFLDLENAMRLEFHPPDLDLFPCVRLAYQAIETGGTAPAVLNAANEIAVAAYLEERIGFLQIPEIIGETLEHHERREANDLETVLAADTWAREEAQKLVAVPARVRFSARRAAHAGPPK
jgi:1-deoxy-D-xylulose-5-phosphate reductoisomerase